jgi:site-specific recombinase XerD
MTSALTIDRNRWPVVIRSRGERTRKRFLEFFTAQIRNENTRKAYFRAASRFFGWCEECGLELQTIEPLHVATYIEEFTKSASAPTVKQHLAAIRMLFDWLVTGQIVPSNPAASVRGPKHVVKKGKTSVLSADEAKALIESIPTDSIVGLRDRAIMGVMLYSFARVSAVCGLKVHDVFSQGRRTWFRLHEKGGKHHEVPAHHIAEQYVDAYLDEAGIRDEPKSLLFRSSKGRGGELSSLGLDRADVFRMIRRRAHSAGLSTEVSCHTFRATGITVFLENGGSIEMAAEIAAHESPRTTKLYDRTGDALTLDEIERIRL